MHLTALRRCVQRRLSQLVVAATGVTDVPFGTLSASAFIELDGRLGAHIRSAPFQEKVRGRVVPLSATGRRTRLTVAAVAGGRAGGPTDWHTVGTAAALSEHYRQVGALLGAVERTSADRISAVEALLCETTSEQCGSTHNRLYGLKAEPAVRIGSGWPFD